MTQYQIIVASRTGEILGECDGELQTCTWRTNKYGTASITLSSQSSQLLNGWYEFGALVFIRFDNLRSWVGAIDTPRKWDGGGNVIIKAYSGEYLLKRRRTDKGRYFSGATVGSIAYSLLSEMVAIPAFGIGNIWYGGETHSPSYHLKSIYDIMTDSVTGTLSDAVFEVAGDIASGKLQMQFNLLNARGRDASNYAFVEGANIASVGLAEQGAIANRWQIAGADISGDAASGWGDGRLISTADDLDSQNLYGRRESSIIFNGISSSTTLDGRVNVLLADSAYPKNTYDLTVIDEQPAKFADYWLGDRVTLLAPSIGISGTHTIVTVNELLYDATNDQIQLTAVSA